MGLCCLSLTQLSIKLFPAGLILCCRSLLTLCQESMLAHMFSGRHEDKVDRDASGNVFFDYSPAVMVRCVWTECVAGVYHLWQ